MKVFPFRRWTLPANLGIQAPLNYLGKLMTRISLFRSNSNEREQYQSTLHEQRSTSMSNVDELESEEVSRFIGQYLQLVPLRQLRWPRPEQLRTARVQERLFNDMFDQNRLKWMPPERYQFLILKALVSKIEASIAEPDEEVGLESRWKHSVSSQPRT